MMATVGGWSVTGVPSGRQPSPSGALVLAQNVPNPFLPGTRIDFRLPAAAAVRLEIFDTAGRKVATLVDGTLVEGLHSVAWNGRSSAGRRVAAGTYFYRLQADNRTVARRMTVLR